MPAWALSRCATIRAINENLRRADADFFLSENCSILKNLQYYEKYFCQTPRIKSSCYWNYWKFAIGHTAFVEFCSKENAPSNEANSVHASKCFRRMKTGSTLVGSGCTADSSVSGHLYVTGVLGTTNSSYLW